MKSRLRLIEEARGLINVEVVRATSCVQAVARNWRADLGLEGVEQTKQHKEEDMNLEWPEVVRRRNLDKEGLIRKKIKNKVDADEKNGRSEQETKVEADERTICTVASNWDSQQEEDCLCRCSTCGQLSVRDYAVSHFICATYAVVSTCF